MNSPGSSITASSAVMNTPEKLVLLLPAMTSPPLLLQKANMTTFKVMKNINFVANVRSKTASVVKLHFYPLVKLKKMNKPYKFLVESVKSPLQ